MEAQKSIKLIFIINLTDFFIWKSKKLKQMWKIYIFNMKKQSKNGRALHIKEVILALRAKLPTSMIILKNSLSFLKNSLTIPVAELVLRIGCLWSSDSIREWRFGDECVRTLRNDSKVKVWEVRAKITDRWKGWDERVDL